MTEVITAEGVSERDLLRAVASLERASEHPLAASIVAGAQERGVGLAEAREFASVTGKGVTGVVDGRRVAVGNVALMEEEGVDAGAIEQRADSLRRNGSTVMLAALDGRAAGLIAVADPVKESSKDVVDSLKKSGVKVVMVTGDNRTTAEAVANRLGIVFEAEVSPEGKAEVIRRLQKEGKIVAMAGDGVNDAPALAAAQVGIAMGTGTDVAMAAGGITLVSGDLRGLLRARKLSERTMKNIRQNLFFAFVYNAADAVGGRSAVSAVRVAAESDVGCCGDELQLGFGDCECSAVEDGEAVREGDGASLDALLMQETMLRSER